MVSPLYHSSPLVTPQPECRGLPSHGDGAASSDSRREVHRVNLEGQSQGSRHRLHQWTMQTTVPHLNHRRCFTSTRKKKVAVPTAGRCLGLRESPWGGWDLLTLDHAFQELRWGRGKKGINYSTNGRCHLVKPLKQSFIGHY